MRHRRLSLGFVAVALVATAVPGGPVAQVHGAEYTLETSADYDVRPAAGTIAVSVEVTFTNTTPDPPGQFSVFDEVKIAVHDEATEVTAEDEDGALDVNVEVEEGVNVATVELREELRYEETAMFEVSYSLPDSEDPRLRVRPSLVVFPAWSFGTSGEVDISLPAGYEVRVDGDPLTEEGGTLTSGAIDDPSQWLALVTAARATEYTPFEAAVPLAGGTADMKVRAFADDEAWGERTLALMVEALPLLEEAIGLPYPRIGQLVLTESATAGSAGFGESGGDGNEILVAFDQPEFTVLHQASHIWISPSFVEARWIREGLASHFGGLVAAELEIEAPYDPVEVAEQRADAAFPLDGWSANAGADGEAYGYAASWAFMADVEASVGREALRTVLRRVAASMGPYQAASIDPQPPADGVNTPATPLTTRSFLDHLETVSGAELADLFADRVLTEADVALLDDRAEARAAFDRLTAIAGDWGAPDPVRGAMTAWSFGDATSQMREAGTWLAERDRLLAEMSRVGLRAPDRLQQAYRSYGGGPEAVAELDAQGAVVDSYASVATEVNGGRSFVERIGLIGGPDPASELALANGRFAEGDLRGAIDAIGEAQRIVAAAESAGIVRIASAVLLIVILLGLALLLFRRRASYTAAR